MSGTLPESSPVQGTASKPEPRLLSMEVAASLIGISRRQLYRWVAEGHVTAVRIGQRRFMPTEELDALVARLKAEAIAEREAALEGRQFVPSISPPQRVA